MINCIIHLTCHPVVLNMTWTTPGQRHLLNKHRRPLWNSLLPDTMTPEKHQPLIREKYLPKFNCSVIYQRGLGNQGNLLNIVLLWELQIAAEGTQIVSQTNLWNEYFYPSALRPEGYCRCLRPSVCLSVCLSVCPSVCLSVRMTMLVRAITRKIFFKFFRNLPGTFFG